MSDWSKPVQYASFHPSPYESLIERVHDEPYVTVALPKYGAPPLTLVPSVHESVQLTSDGQFPELTLMVLVPERSEGGEGGEGGESGGEGRNGGEGGGKGGKGGDGQVSHVAGQAVTWPYELL